MSHWRWPVFSKESPKETLRAPTVDLLRLREEGGEDDSIKSAGLRRWRRLTVPNILTLPYIVSHLPHVAWWKLLMLTYPEVCHFLKDIWIELLWCIIVVSDLPFISFLLTIEPLFHPLNTFLLNKCVVELLSSFLLLEKFGPSKHAVNC